MGKKDFGSLKSPIGNTALNFISADPIAEVEQEEVNETKKVDISNGRKRAGRPKLRETKSQRVVLLLKPSTYEEMHEEADSIGVSVNEFYEILLKDYFEKKKFE